jgi:glutathione S-transferase
MMTIYHLVPAQIWRACTGPTYSADSLATEGFIHCSFAGQVAGAANRFYADQQEMLVLQLDPSRLTSPVCEEPSGTGEIFPHVYGPINRDAVVAVQFLPRGTDGRWQFGA